MCTHCTMRTINLIFRKSDGIKYIKAVNRIELFKHCANGSMEVSYDVYEKSVEPLLWMHNISQIIEDSV